MIATQVPRRLSFLKTSSTRASSVIPAAHWAETTTVPPVGEVLRRHRKDAMDGPWQTLIGRLGRTLLADGRSENISHKRKSHVAS
jgi:hypothetical protein